MTRILVFGMTENPGGVESFLISYYRCIDKSKIQFDFLCNSYETVAYEDELKRCGSRCFHITARSKNYVKYSKELDTIFKKHACEWDGIWVNVCSLANIDYLKKAKKYGLRKRIIHCHNSKNMDGVARGVLHRINRRRLKRYATDYWTCSLEAAKWFFLSKDERKIVVIHNAIDLDSMKFNLDKRNQIREKYGWNDEFVIGNIGRLHFQKNQTFILEIFKKFLSIYPESILVLVGQGEDERKLKSKVKSLKIETKVYLVGVQSDIQGWLSSFDCFLFPSKFEGLGIAALEAQANGLPVLASQKVIPEEVKMNRNFVFQSLDDSADKWSSKMNEMRKLGREQYIEVEQNFIEKGYAIKTEVPKLEKLLIE